MPLCAVAQVPDEIATIVDKAMARNPDDRYPNASALAEDLRRYQTGKLVTAHSYSTWALLRKKLSHHRGVVAVAVGPKSSLVAPSRVARFLAGSEEEPEPPYRLTLSPLDLGGPPPDARATWSRRPRNC